MHTNLDIRHNRSFTTIRERWIHILGAGCTVQLLQVSHIVVGHLLFLVGQQQVEHESVNTGQSTAKLKVLTSHHSL